MSIIVGIYNNLVEIPIILFRFYNKLKAKQKDRKELSEYIFQKFVLFVLKIRKNSRSSGNMTILNKDFVCISKCNVSTNCVLTSVIVIQKLL